MNFILALLSIATASAAYISEVKDMPEHTIKDDFIKPQPHEYINADDIPAAFTWADIDGISYLTKSLNQVRLDEKAGAKQQLVLCLTSLSLRSSPRSLFAAHSPVLWFLLGSRCSLRPWRPHQDGPRSLRLR